jgi:hypothetical protein
MAENNIYLALGEESSRGTKEDSTVGFIPLLGPGIPKMEFDDKKRKEFRGEDTVKGDTTVLRMSRKWAGSLEMPFFTEAGSTVGMLGTLLKHFFGTATSAQQGATLAYAHMLYPVADPFASANLGDKALTVNLNINEGSTMKNWPFVGGRVSALTFEQEAGQHLKLTAELFGQTRDVTTAELGSPSFAAENLRCDYNNLSVYTGTITRTGTGPDFTDFSFASATRLKPDKISVKIEDGKIDWEDPASGFSSVDEFTNWITSAGSTNFCLEWDTGTEAGTGYNHKLILDVPMAQRMGGEPEYDLEKDPMTSLNYEGLYDESTTKYILGCVLQNTATAV